MRLEFVPCCPEGDVGLIGRTATTGEHGNDTAFSVKDGGARVPLTGEGATPAVGQDGGLEGSKLEVIVDVVTNKRFESVYPADGSAGGQAVLDDRHGRITVSIKLLGLANLALRHDAVDLKEPILWVLVANLVQVVREHEVTVFFLLDPAPCAIINELLVHLKLALGDEAR